MKGLELKEKRKSLNLTQEELGKAVGLGRKTILKLEKLDEIDEAKSTILDNYFKSKVTFSTSIELTHNGTIIPNKVWIEYLIRNEEELLKTEQALFLWVDNKVKDGVIKVLSS